MFFDMITTKSICKTCSKECVVQTSGCEKKHVTIVLSATADSKMLPLVSIFKGTTEKTIQKLRIPEGFVIKTQEKAWKDERLMHVWVENIWSKHTKAMSEKLDFRNSLLKFNAFSAHKTDEIQGKLIEKKTDILMIPPGCTSKCQPMDVCINKPFKAILRKCWVEYVSEMINKEHVQLPPPSHQDMVDWLEKALNCISNNTQMFSRSFDVCSITTTDSSKVRSGSFYKSCMVNASKHLQNDEEEDDLFVL